jgi:hypothetical protein
MKDNVQIGSIVISYISYHEILEANAARFVKMHRIYNTKHDDPKHETKSSIQKTTTKKQVPFCLLKTNFTDVSRDAYPRAPFIFSPACLLQPKCTSSSGCKLRPTSLVQAGRKPRLVVRS